MYSLLVTFSAIDHPMLTVAATAADLLARKVCGLLPWRNTDGVPATPVDKRPPYTCERHPTKE